MEDIIKIIDMALENWTTLTALVILLISVIRATAWGKANKKALDMVVEAIEQDNAQSVKDKVTAAKEFIGSDAAHALILSVRKADPQEETPSTLEVASHAVGIKFLTKSE